MNIYQILLRPVVTEKSMEQREENKYVFEVARNANKQMIKRAVEELFDVTVLDVKTMIVKGKARRWGRTQYRTSDWKKAVVTVAAGDSIAFFEGV